MGKVTFVVEYEDGKEPQVSAETLILGGKLVSVAWRDLVISQPKPVSESLPAPSNTVLLFDANGEGWLLGWRSVFHTLGGKETGDWRWNFQVFELSHEDVNITHWDEIPGQPEDV